MRTSGEAPALAASQALDEACAWLARSRPGERLESDPEFGRWLERSTHNRAAWASARLAWDEFEDAQDPLIAALRTQALRARAPRRARRWAPAAIAAGLVILVGASASWVALHRVEAPASQARPAVSLAAAELTTKTLPDGTVATLDAGSTLELSFDARRRIARLLKGRVFLVIAADTARPFRIDAGARQVTDKGTAFEVALSGDQVTVTLTEGEVVVAGGERPVALKPGEQLVANGRQDRVRLVSSTEVTDWRLRKLTFVETPLADALAEVNRYGGLPARSPDPRTANIKVSGAFRTGDPGRFAAAVAQLNGLRLAKRADGGVDILPRD